MGFSPGDTFSPEPYLYVGPHDAGSLSDPFWNAPLWAPISPTRSCAAARTPRRGRRLHRPWPGRGRRRLTPAPPAVAVRPPTPRPAADRPPWPDRLLRRRGRSRRRVVRDPQQVAGAAEHGGNLQPQGARPDAVAGGGGPAGGAALGGAPVSPGPRRTGPGTTVAKLSMRASASRSSIGVSSTQRSPTVSRPYPSSVGSTVAVPV